MFVLDTLTAYHSHMSADRITADSPGGVPIQVAARRSGLSTDLVRAWERRYGAVRPARDRRNRRIYSERDVERLRLLRRAIDAGHRIGDLAGRPTAALAALVDEAPGGTPPPAGLAAALEAVQCFDGAALRGALDGAARSLGVPAVLDGFVTPLLVEIGNRWQRGELRAAHEHAATETVREFLAPLLRTASMGDDGPRIVVATPAGQLHDMGALTVAIYAAVDGWQVTFLGRSSPAAEIACAAASTGACAVALSQARVVDDSHLREEMTALRRMLHPHIPILVGGPGALRQRATLRQAGARVLDDIRSYRVELDGIRGGRASCDPGAGATG